MSTRARNVAVTGYSSMGIGVRGQSNGSAHGVEGISARGVGGLFAGAAAALHLVPALTAGHPLSGLHLRGDLLMDRTGTLWVCVANGSPGTWHRILTADQTARERRVVLQIIQPGLAGLMDGSVSTLAPIFATAFATHVSHTVFFVGLAAQRLQVGMPARSSRSRRPCHDSNPTPLGRAVTPFTGSRGHAMSLDEAAGTQTGAARGTHAGLR